MALTYSGYTVLPRGSPAPDFSLKGIDGNEYSLSSFQGKKAVLIVFMCNHCPFVIPKIKKLVELQQEYGDAGLQVIGINSNDVSEYPEDSFEKMKEFVIEKKINFPYLFDETQAIAKAYGAQCTPDPFLFDAGLKLAYHGRIDDAHQKDSEHATTNELEEAIRLVLDEKEAPGKTIPSMGCNIKWT
jgi:peroxiredoxin